MASDSDAALTGAAHDLAQAGYRLMPDPQGRKKSEAIGSDVSSLREAAAQLSEPSEPPVARGYSGEDGKPAPMTDAVTLDRAARDYAFAVAADRLLAENATGDKLAARVDALRAEAWVNDPERAEALGYERPRAESDPAVRDKAKAQSALVDAPEGLDPELARALRHPQVAQAIEQRINEAEQTRQGYAEGLAAATRIAQMSFLGQFPEFAGVAPEQWPQIAAEIGRRDPSRLTQLQASVAATQSLFAQQQQENACQAEAQRSELQAYTRAEDDRFETMMKNEPLETQRAVAAELRAFAHEHGIRPSELRHLFMNEPLMRHAAFQRMMYDAGKYRLIMKARDAATAKALPSVQRPGQSRSAAERDHADLKALSAKLSSSGNIRDAVALYNARKATRR